MSSSQGRTRREILTDAAKVAAAASVAGFSSCFPDVGGKWPSPSACKEPDGGTTDDATAPAPVTPAVVEVFRQESVVTGATGNVIQPDVVAAMLDTGLAALARQVAQFNAGSVAQDGGSEEDDGGQPQPAGGTDNPWTVLLPNYQPGQSIGLKVNCLNRNRVTTSLALTGAIVASLRDKLGVDPTKIVVWDRYLSDLQDRGKFTPDAVFGAQILGNLIRGAEDGENQDDPKLTDGRGFGPPICQAPIGVPSGIPPAPARFPRLSRILTDETHLTINCPILKIHNISGITGAMKNIYGMIDNPEQYHDKNLKTDMPKLYALPAIRRSISLTICDALIGIVNGVSPDDTYDSTPGRIWLAQDPVALDSYMLNFVSQLRAAAGKGSIDAKANPWLDAAASAGLGTRTYSLIQV